LETLKLTWKSWLGAIQGGVDWRHGGSPVDVTSACPSAWATKDAQAPPSAVPAATAVRRRTASFDDIGVLQ